MATDRLGDARRSIGTANEKSRRGFDNSAARRAIGTRIEAERRGTSVQEDINRLVIPERPPATLRPVTPRGALPAQRGRADYKAPAASAGGAGLASPLTEVELEGVGDRTYWPATIQETTDGLISFEVMPIKTWKFLDADGNAAVLNVAKPPVSV